MTKPEEGSAGTLTMEYPGSQGDEWFSKPPPPSWEHIQSMLLFSRENEAVDCG